MVLSHPADAAAYLAGLIDGEGGVYVWPKQHKALIRITMTDREPLDGAAEACATLDLRTVGVRERGTTRSGRTIYVVEVQDTASIILAPDVLDLRHPGKRAKLAEAAEYRRASLARREPQPCSKCGKKEKPLRRGLCNACRLRARKAAESVATPD